MLLLVPLADHYSLHINIVIMCVMYIQTRNRDNETECDNEWTMQRQHTFTYLHIVATCSASFAELCTVNYVHVICTGACRPSCMRSALVRSMQGTPLAVQSKSVSTPNVAAMPLWLVGCFPLFENLVPTTISLPRLLHWLNTFCCT